MRKEEMVDECNQLLLTPLRRLPGKNGERQWVDENWSAGTGLYSEGEGRSLRKVSSKNYLKVVIVKAGG